MTTKPTPQEIREALDVAIGLLIGVANIGTREQRARYAGKKITLTALRDSLDAEPVVDRFVTQEKFGVGDVPADEQGDCTECAVACYFGMPRSRVPQFHGDDGAKGFWDRFEQFFNSRGYAAQRFPGNFAPEHLYIACGTTARGTKHTVVMKDGKLYHDPHPSRAGLEKIEHVYAAIPLDIDALNKRLRERDKPDYGLSQFAPPAAPSAQGSVPDALVDDGRPYADSYESGYRTGRVDGWNECRANMLASAPPASSAQDDAWRPIETAPKHYTKKIIARNRHGEFIVAWANSDCWMDDAGNELDGLVAWRPLHPPASAQDDARDARRYRWLRPRLLSADFAYGDPPGPVIVFEWPSEWGVSANLDATIDAALSAPADEEAS